MDFVGCKMSSRKLLKAVWPRNGHADSLGVKNAFLIILKEGTTCMISGWGDVNQKDNGIQQPESLQVAFVQIANFEKCAEAYKPLSRFLKTRKHLCAQGEGTDTCQ